MPLRLLHQAAVSQAGGIRRRRTDLSMCTLVLFLLQRDRLRSFPRYHLSNELQLLRPGHLHEQHCHRTIRQIQPEVRLPHR